MIHDKFTNLNLTANQRWVLRHPEQYKDIVRKHNHSKNARQNENRYKAKNIDKVKEWKKKWRLRNPERASQAALSWHRRTKYGLSDKEYADLIIKQDGKCAICHKSETATRNGRTRSLGVDHNHETKKIRGLLCNDCNFALGKVHEDVEILKTMIMYLEKHK